LEVFIEKLIAALQIFLKYGNPDSPTHCEHDVLTVCGIEPSKVSEEDTRELANLGFFIDMSEDCFKSYRFGSA
jgi:hypothetical protein